MLWGNTADNVNLSGEDLSRYLNKTELECGPMPIVMATLPNIGATKFG